MNKSAKLEKYSYSFTLYQDGGSNYELNDKF